MSFQYLANAITVRGCGRSSLQWRSQKFSTEGASTDAHIVCRIRLESIEARLSLTDKNIGTSARFTRRPITLINHIPKIMYFPDGVRTPPFATCMGTPLRAYQFSRLPGRLAAWLLQITKDHFCWGPSESRRTPQPSIKKHLTKIWRSSAMQFSSYASGQVDKQTNVLITKYTAKVTMKI